MRLRCNSNSYDDGADHSHTHFVSILCAYLSSHLAHYPNTVLPILRHTEGLRSVHIDCDPWYSRFGLYHL
jgi:hypothetical protein